MYNYLFMAVLSIMVIFGEVQMRMIALGKGGWRKGFEVSHVIYFIMKYVWVMVAAWRGMPLCLFLAVYFVMEWISVRRYQRDDNMMQWVSTMKFLVLACTVMIILGGTAMGGTDIVGLSVYRGVRCYTLAGAASVATGFGIVWKHFFQSRDGGMEKEQDSRKSRIFLIFLRCCLGYVFIDSLLCLFPFEGIFPPLLLINGNVLTLVLIFLFLRHNYIIAKNQYLEQEYERVEAQKARDLFKQEQMDMIARIDGLTGAYTRRHGSGLTRQMLEKDILLTVVYIDLDGLKNINDEKGHKAGDECLKVFTEEFKSRLRKNDLFIRLGGDEFLAVMPYAEEEKVKEKVLKIREEFAEKDGVGLSFSFGTASGKENLDELIKKADKIMYQDKKRDR